MQEVHQGGRLCTTGHTVFQEAASSPQMAPSASQPSRAAGKGCWPFLQGGAALPHSSPWGKVVDSIASKLAFFPPTPASYTVQEHNDNTGELYIQPVDRWVWIQLAVQA